MKFLSKTAKDIFDKYSDNLDDLTIIFPIERAGFFLRKELQKLIKKPVFMPEIKTFEQWGESITNIHKADDINLIFYLFESYKLIANKHNKNNIKDFDVFYSFGKILLSDFNEIDDYYIESEKIFKELKNIGFVNKRGIEYENSEMFKRYNDFFELLPEIYENFTNILKAEKIGYKGLILRTFAENVDTFNIESKKVIFIGFNIITKSEELIMKYLLSEKKADFYFDIDEYYLNEINEGGFFFRKNKENLKLENINWVENNFKEKKDIELISVTTKVSEAKTVGEEIYNLIEEKGDKEAENNTAIVLCDKSILFPILNSLPESLKKYNIAVSHGFKQTPLYSLVSYIIESKQNQIYYEVDVEKKYYYKDIEKILTHPYIKNIVNSEISILELIIKNNMVFVEYKDLMNDSSLTNICSIIFSEWKSIHDMFESLLNLMIELKKSYLINVDKTEYKHPIEIEYIYHFENVVNKITKSLQNYRTTIKLETFWKVFNEVMEDFYIAFTGNTLEGLQVLSIEQTMLLDFENIYILSLNEGIFPYGKSYNTFIPYDVRIDNKMLVVEEADSDNAYIFYRLIQRSKNIKIFYQTESERFGKSEKSRFIEQLMVEYEHFNENNIKIASFTSKNTETEKISVVKNESTVEILKNKKFSPYFFNTYFTCPLKFYYQEILNLKNEEEVMETADDKTFGKVVHDLLREVYNKKITDYNPYLNDVKKNLSPLIEKHYMKTAKIQNINKGKNKLNITTIKEILENFFDYEIERLPFEIVTVEKTYEYKLEIDDFKITLKGNFDRVEIKDRTYTVIDYKTGKHITNTIKPEAEENFKLLKPEQFQLLLYGYLLLKNTNTIAECKLGIYHFLSKEIKMLKKGSKEIKFDINYAEGFQDKLKKIIKEILDIKTPFTQTEEIENCGYCQYSDICKIKK